jgi:uncharacterized protein (TIGR02246 family)
MPVLPSADFLHVFAEHQSRIPSMLTRRFLCATIVSLASLSGSSASAGAPANPAEQAIRKSSQDFTRAFDKADAKTIAAFWTEQGEFHAEDGSVLRGRAVIEKAFAEFFKNNPHARSEVLIDSIRFPAKDLAIEEGHLRQSVGKELPATTQYSVIHIREGGQWKIALAREWGGGQDRLHDLDWLIGSWSATVGDQEAVLTLARDRKPFIVGTFTKKAKGKVVAAGSLRIGFDGQKGMLRSWHFDDDGGHGEALWVRDGNRWVLDSVGVTGDGAEAASVNILTRLNNREITWQSIDRVIGGQALPDSAPIKLVRVEAAP